VVERYYNVLLNPVNLISFDSFEMHRGQNTITPTEITVALQTLKAGRAAGCNEIQPEMHRVLNREGISC